MRYEKSPALAINADMLTRIDACTVPSVPGGAGMSDPALVDLHFEDSGKWYSLPEWAEYFIGVGKQLAFAPQAESRIVTAIIVPTRAFGAAFLSLGMVISDAASRDQASESAHFEKLFDLPPGTPMVHPSEEGGGPKRRDANTRRSTMESCKCECKCIIKARWRDDISH